MKSMTLTTTLIFAILLIFSSYSVNAQDSILKDSELKQNSIYGNVGNAWYYFTATAYYERILVRTKDVSLFARSGFGVYEVALVDGGQYFHAQFGVLTGQGTHHLELAAGPNWILNGRYKGKLPLGGGFGYRLQKPGSHFMFRAGVSAPEAIYVGVGIPF